MKTEAVSLKHSFDNKDLAALAQQQARAYASKQTLELEAKSVATDFKGRVAQAAAEMSSLSARISAGFEMRTLDCLIADEREEGYRLVVRLDTGHIVKRRKLTPEERQIKLTDTPPEQYVAAALLPVDCKEDWDVEMFLVRLFAEEFDALRKLPDVKMTDWKPALALAAPENKKRPSKKK